MTQRISMYAIYTALAFVFSYIESLIPFNVGIPGIKPGFANIVVLLVLCTSKHISDAYSIAVIRVIMVGLTYGNMSTMIYSLAGTLFATTSMLIFSYSKKNSGLLSTTGISIIGGITHNIGQLIAAIIMLSTKGLIYYLPFLVIAGLIAGMVTGIITDRCIRHLERIISSPR